MANVMLSTVDNPYNPFTDFDEWYAFDDMKAREENRPTCCSYLARMMKESDDVSDQELEEITEAVVDDICELNLTGKFIKIVKETAKKMENGEEKPEEKG